MTTDMPVTEVAYAAGFKSLRRFNEVFRELFDSSPTDLRKNSAAIGQTLDQGITIPWSQGFKFERAIGFMKPRALKGVEIITDTSYTRSFRLKGSRGYFTVKNDKANKCLILSIDCDDPKVWMPITQQVRRMFDLNTNFDPIRTHLSQDPLLKSSIESKGIPPIPVAFNAFEFIVRAILGQVVSVSFATTLAERLTERAHLSTLTTGLKALIISSLPHMN